MTCHTTKNHENVAPNRVKSVSFIQKCSTSKGGTSPLSIPPTPLAAQCLLRRQTLVIFTTFTGNYNFVPGNICIFSSPANARGFLRQTYFFYGLREADKIIYSSSRVVPRFCTVYRGLRRRASQKVKSDQ